MEDYKNALLDEWAGRAVLVKCLKGPDSDTEFAERLEEDPLNVRDQLLQSRITVRVLESYDRLGIVLRTIEDDPFRSFVPWGAVIEISRA